MIRSAAIMMLCHVVLRLALIPLLTVSLACQKESESVVSIALHPKNADILYVATDDAVYKSRDGGGTWEKFSSFSARRVTTLAIDPLFPTTIYASRDERLSVKAG